MHKATAMSPMTLFPRHTSLGFLGDINGDNRIKTIILVTQMATDGPIQWTGDPNGYLWT